MRTLIALIAPLALSGCFATFDMFENDVSCSVARDKAYVNSMYGTIGVSSKIRAKAAAELCGQKKSEDK